MYPRCKTDLYCDHEAQWRIHPICQLSSAPGAAMQAITDPRRRYLAPGAPGRSFTLRGASPLEAALLEASRLEASPLEARAHCYPHGPIRPHLEGTRS
jgi:hypothetical protein